MQPSDGRASATDSELAAARAFFKRVGKGWRAWSSEKRSLVGKMVSAKGWATRRQRYGESGSRPLNYKRYREARGLAAIGDDGREIKEQTKLPSE